MTTDDTKRTGRKIAVAALLLSGSNAFRLGVQLLLFPVLARLLGPADYGVMALAMPVVMFALTVGDGGMGPAFMRAADPHGVVAATMFWAALATGMGCAALLLLGSPLIATALSHPAIAPVLAWLAPMLLLSAICSVPAARIQKSGAMWVFALGDVASTVAGAAAALYLAVTGWGVWALVAQQLAIWVVKTVVMLALGGTGIGARPNRAALFYLMRHGAPLMGANLLTLFSNSIDNIMIGRLLGVQPLGFYALAYQIVRIPESLVNGPVFISFLPAVARLDTDRPAAARLFMASLRLMFSLAAPLMLGLAITADLAVPLLLGPRWHATAPLLSLLAPSAVAQTLGWVSMALLLGLGRSALQFHLALLNAALTVAGVLAGAAFGVFGIAAGVSLAVVIGSLVALAAAMREVRVSVRELVASLSPALAAVTIMTGGVLVVRALLPTDMPPLPSMALAAATGVVLYGGAMQLLAPDTVAAALTLFRRPRPPVTDGTA